MHLSILALPWLSSVEVVPSYLGSKTSTVCYSLLIHRLQIAIMAEANPIDLAKHSRRQGPGNMAPVEPGSIQRVRFHDHMCQDSQQEKSFCPSSV